MRMFAMVAACAVFMAACAVEPASAGEQAIEGWTGGFFDATGWRTQGWTFSVTGSIRVTQLGLWDANQNGLDEEHRIRIWNSLGVELADATLPQTGQTGMTWHWVDLASPVELGPGSYVIGGFYRTSTDAVRVLTGNVVSGPGVLYGEHRYSDGDAMPVTHGVGYDEGIFGPNFRYDPVPEPALIQLPVLVGLGACAWWRRRTRGAPSKICI